MGDLTLAEDMGWVKMAAALEAALATERAEITRLRAELEAANAEVNPLRQKASRVDMMELELQQVRTSCATNAQEIIKWRPRAELAEARLAALESAADWRAGHVRISCHGFYDVETIERLTDTLLEHGAEGSNTHLFGGPPLDLGMEVPE